MSLITLAPSGQTIEAIEGASILSAILAALPDFPHKCEGNAKCGSCHISLLEGRKGVSKISKEENEMLDTTGRRRLQVTAGLPGQGSWHGRHQGRNSEALTSLENALQRRGEKRWRLPKS